MERRDAFTQLVRRYQDLAFSCAYAALGNLSLAEEAAQEAFVTAWEKLDQLRDPAAFPGWLRAIVHTQCSRLTRGAHLVLVPLEAAGEVAAAAPPEKAEVLGWIRALPEAERVVTLLHYLGGYGQDEIAGFLEVTTGAVAKRLFSARRRLRRQAVEALRAARPSRDDAFEQRVAGRLRAADARDRVPVGALAILHHREEDWLRARRQHEDSRRVRRQYVVEHAGSGELLGYGCVEQSAYLPRFRMFLVADPRWLRDGVGALLLDRLLADLAEAGAVTVALEEHAAREDLRAFLGAHGFVETRRTWDLRLDVDEVPDLAPAPPPGVTIATLAAERARDPRCLEKRHELSASLGDDPVRPPAYDDREARIWVDRPCVLPDGAFIAVEDGRHVGMCDVSFCGSLPGQLRHGATGVAPDRRRRGIGTALKRAAIQFARAHAHSSIRAFNAVGNDAIIALNEKLGFKRRGSSVTLERCLRPVAAVDPAIYDQYVGRYGDLVITKEDGRLFGETLGQKFELHPESERQFFVKWFHGSAEFERRPGEDAPWLTMRHRAEVMVCAPRSSS